MKNICETFRYMQAQKGIVVGEISRHLLHTKKYCSDYYKKPFKQLINFSTHNFGMTPHAWPLKIGAPFVDSFNKHIKQTMSGIYSLLKKYLHQFTFSGGLLQIWREKVLLEEKIYTYSRKILIDQEKNITFKSFMGQFGIYLIGISVSTVCFFLEIIYNRWSKTNKES
jgi:hypothetical protein